MNITVHSTFLPHDDPDPSLGFYRDTLGSKAGNDIAYGGMPWITVGPRRAARDVDFRLPVRP